MISSTHHCEVSFRIAPPPPPPSRKRGASSRRHRSSRPGVIAAAADSDRYDGFVALGCVIRGETSHYDYICQETARALMDLSLIGVPLGNGILTVESMSQAMERAMPDRKNKGADAANAALRMIELKAKFEDE